MLNYMISTFAGTWVVNCTSTLPPATTVPMPKCYTRPNMRGCRHKPTCDPLHWPLPNCIRHQRRQVGFTSFGSWPIRWEGPERGSTVVELLQLVLVQPHHWSHFWCHHCCMDKLEPGLGLGLRFVYHGSLLCCCVCVHGKVSVQKQCSQGQPPPKYPTGSHKFCINNWSPASLCSVIYAHKFIGSSILIYSFVFECSGSCGCYQKPKASNSGECRWVTWDPWQRSRGTKWNSSENRSIQVH